MTLSQEVHDVGRELTSATESTLPDILNRILGQFLRWPLKVTTGSLVDLERNKSRSFASIVYAASESVATPEVHDVRADNAAAIIDAYESLDLESFRESFRGIAQAKRLKKSKAPSLEGIPVTTITLGIIFSLRSRVPLEHIAEELNRLNAQTPSREWPDMVVVASTGIVNYAVQFPGESISGDFLPPAEPARDAPMPPVYVIIVQRPTGAYTFNKMLAFLIAHLRIFSPGVQLPSWDQILEGVPKEALVISGYQYNLNGDLLPVPRQFYNDRYLPPLPMRIEDKKGTLLCTLQFLPWQDGGTIVLRGKLPLERLMTFLGNEALRRGGVIKRGDLQIAYVLPITREDVFAMLTRIQQQSNMVVRREEPKWTIQKVSDEGAQSPFIARLFMGILKLRDVVTQDPEERAKFDESYDVVLSPLQTARKSTQRIVQLWKEHSHKVTSGKVARMHGQMIRVDESIDMELRKEVESFVTSAGRTLKEGMQKFASGRQVDIGFLFQKPSVFEARAAVLEHTDRALANYLRQTRTWSERLQQCRNDIEHKGWILPSITYSRSDDTIKVNEPSISGQPVTEFVAFVFDRLSCFVEELTVYCLQREMPPEVTIAEIASAQRLKEAPERFRVTLVRGGLPVWQIAYHHSAFEEA